MSHFNASSIILRDNQERVITQIRQAYADGYVSPMLVASTGFGKTICFSYIAENAARLNNRVFILVHIKELIRQTVESLKKNNIPHGVIAAGYPMRDALIQVCSIQTLIRRFHLLSPPELIVYDESHHLKANIYKKVFDWAGATNDNGKIISPHTNFLSVTATPIRADGQGFSDVCDIMIEADSIKTLIEEGWLVKPKYFAPEIPELNNLSDLAIEEELDKPVIIGSAIEHYKRYLPHYPPTIVFCRNVKHAQRVADQFCAAGIPSASIDGTMDDETRKKYVKQLESGEIRCLMSCNLISEGFDLPVVEAAIMLRKIGPKCLALHIQQLGRVLRPAPGKTIAYIFDHVKNLETHGFAECDQYGNPRDWRKGFYGELPKAPKEKGGALVTCPKCYEVFLPEPICPGCGHNLRERNGTGPTQEIKEIEGNLVEVDLNRLQFKATTAKGRQKQVIKKLLRT